MNRRIDMENDLVKMVSLSGFIDVFWDRVKANRIDGGNQTYKEIYADMEADFSHRYGVTRFPSYDAFRKARDRQK